MISRIKRFIDRKKCPQCSSRMPERSRKWMFPWTCWGCTQCGAQLKEQQNWSILFAILQATGIALFAFVFPRLVLTANSTNAQAVLCMLPGIIWLLLTTWLYPSFVLPKLVARAACPKCGYSLAGNTTGICPECGRPVPPKLRQT